MGLIGGLLTLPLAPVRQTVWIAELIQMQAEQEVSSDEAAVMGALAELEEARLAGELSEAEMEEAENALVEQLVALRNRNHGEGHGGPV